MAIVYEVDFLKILTDSHVKPAATDRLYRRAGEKFREANIPEEKITLVLKSYAG
ncbi:MAG: hypothetical protein QGG67_19575 [Gammaproteobacteria bacterium]|jgi:hypothetical protein|nr:hypothetical protein [Gammaproteobacteria bacterium]HJO10657.1 hypothetical protein [Gammaproteobacteria bacterium]|tara:strand:- start:660 stop:821 length:162 start_codon:yes stop_codon:yes gene_type:complete